MSTAGWIPRASSRSSAVAVARSSIASSSSSAASAGSALELAAREPEREREADEVLLGAVVQVALEPAAGVVGGRDDPGARRAQLLLRGEPVGDVAQVAEEDRRGRRLALERGDRQLDGDLLARRGARR